MRILFVTAAGNFIAVFFFCAPPANGATIFNPSFEEAGPPSPEFLGNSLVDWSSTANTSGIWGVSQGTAALDLALLPPDGSAIGRIYRRASVTGLSFGDFATLYQSVDLTDTHSISFDAALNQVKNSARQNTWSSSLEAQFIIDGVVFWSQTQAGTYFDQSVDTSSLTGMHDIGFRVIAVGTSPDLTGSDWFLFDNLVTTTVPETSTSVVLMLFGGVCLLSGRRRPGAAPNSSPAQ